MTTLSKDQKPETGKTEKLKKAAKHAGIITGSLAAVYYGTILTVAIPTYQFARTNIETDMQDSLKGRYNLAAQSGCYFIEPQQEMTVKFLELRHGFFSSVMTAFTPFVEDTGINHDLGTLPVLHHVDLTCDKLNPAIALTQAQAIQKVAEWTATISDPEQNPALKEIEVKRGFLNTSKGPSL